MGNAIIQVFKAKPYSMKQEDGSLNEGVSIVGMVTIKGSNVPAFQTKIDTPTTGVIQGQTYTGDMNMIVSKTGWPQPIFGPLEVYTNSPQSSAGK